MIFLTSSSVGASNTISDPISFCSAPGMEMDSVLSNARPNSGVSSLFQPPLHQKRGGGSTEYAVSAKFPCILEMFLPHGKATLESALVRLVRSKDHELVLVGRGVCRHRAISSSVHVPGE